MKYLPLLVLLVTAGCSTSSKEIPVAKGSKVFFAEPQAGWYEVPVDSVLHVPQE